VDTVTLTRAFVSFSEVFTVQEELPLLMEEKAETFTVIPLDDL
jgi:hypothetical protein